MSINSESFSTVLAAVAEAFSTTFIVHPVTVNRFSAVVRDSAIAVEFTATVGEGCFERTRPGMFSIVPNDAASSAFEAARAVSWFLRHNGSTRGEQLAQMFYEFHEGHDRASNGLMHVECRDCGVSYKIDRAYGFLVRDDDEDAAPVTSPVDPRVRWGIPPFQLYFGEDTPFGVHFEARATTTGRVIFGGVAAKPTFDAAFDSLVIESECIDRWADV